MRPDGETLSIFCAITLSLALLAPIGSAQVPKGAFVSDDEYRIYNAVFDLMQFPARDPHITISDATLNFKCGEDSGNSTLANGCSFLAISPDTPEGVAALLRNSWADMSESAWADFQQKNMEGARLVDSFVTPWKHRLVGQDIPDDGAKEWESPDMALFLSRVGFNAQKSEAVVYVLSFSYMDKVSTGGDYFLFRLDQEKKWQPHGRVRYFDKDKS